MSVRCIPPGARTIRPRSAGADQHRLPDHRGAGCGPGEDVLHRWRASRRSRGGDARADAWPLERQEAAASEADALSWRPPRSRDGARGMVFGRNVIGAHRPERFLEALKEVVKEGVEPGVAAERSRPGLTTRQAAMSLLLAIDVGTTSVKAGLVRAGRSLRRRGRQEVPARRTPARPGGAGRRDLLEACIPSRREAGPWWRPAQAPDDVDRTGRRQPGRDHGPGGRETNFYRSSHGVARQPCGGGGERDRRGRRRVGKDVYARTGVPPDHLRPGRPARSPGCETNDPRCSWRAPSSSCGRGLRDHRMTAGPSRTAMRLHVAAERRPHPRSLVGGDAGNAVGIARPHLPDIVRPAKRVGYRAPRRTRSLGLPRVLGGGGGMDQAVGAARGRQL